MRFPAHVELGGTRRIEVAERDEVVRPGSEEWLTPADSPIHAAHCMATYYQWGHANGNSFEGRESAHASMLAECHERYILSELNSPSDGAGVQLTPEKARFAAQREYVERVVFAEWWQTTTPAPQVELADSEASDAYEAVMGSHRAWHTLDLPSPYPLPVVAVVSYRRKDTTGIVFSQAAAEIREEAQRKAMLECVMLYLGSKRNERWREGFMRWASWHTAKHLWPGEPDPALLDRAPRDLPEPTVFSRHKQYHFAMCPVPDEFRLQRQKGYAFH